MGRQLLENFWPFLGFARLLGMFPYTRILTEDGAMELKPMAISRKIFCGINACRWTLIISAMTFVSTWMGVNYSNNQTIQCLVDKSGGTSVVHGLVFFFYFLVINLESSFLQKGNFKMREKTCELFSQFKNFDSLYVDNPIWTAFGLLMSNCLRYLQSP